MIRSPGIWGSSSSKSGLSLSLIHIFTKMADMQGLKFRVPQSAVLIAAYKAFGGSPTPISWAETFTALQQGVCLLYTS